MNLYIDGIEEITPESLDELFSILSLENETLWGDGYPSNWTFRGQSNASWPLLLRIYRSNELSQFQSYLEKQKIFIRKYLDIVRKKFEKTLYENMDDDFLLDLISVSLLEYELIHSFAYFANEIAEDFKKNKFSLENWKNLIQNGSVEPIINNQIGGSLTIDAQHYGLPTKYLDWTRNPKVALLFAVERSTENIPSVIWAIDTEKCKNIVSNNLREIFKDRKAGIYIFRSLSYGNKYLHSQSAEVMSIGGRLTMQNYEKKFISFEDTIKLSETKKIVAKRIVYTFSELDKIKTIKRLYQMNISRCHIMPTLESCATCAKEVTNLGLLNRDRAFFNFSD